MTAPEVTTPVSTDRWSHLLDDRSTFNGYVYTTLAEAREEIRRRQSDPVINEYVAHILPQGVPEPMKKGPSMVLFRHIATSNYELSRFVISADVLNELHPMIFEYTEDLFNDRNEWKHSLGRINFHKGANKKGELLYESKMVINFNESNNKPLSTVLTHWGERLVDVHHSLFAKSYPKWNGDIYDLSEWLHTIGPSAKEYYKPFLALFLKHGILFENFMIDGKEGSFTEKIILPALDEIIEETGMKPLIVALEPTSLEGDKFWLSHPFTQKEFLDAKIADTNHGHTT